MISVPSNMSEQLTVEEERDLAIKMLAEWCVAIDETGASWDDWDEYYKNALYRESPIRELLDKAIKEERKFYGE